MTNETDIRINWRSQIKELEPFLEGQGGIVHVHGSWKSACNSFVKLIRQRIAHVPSGLSIRLAHDDPATRYPAAIAFKLAKKVGAALEQQRPDQVLSDIHAGGDISIDSVSIDLSGHGSRDRIPDSVQMKHLLERTAEWVHRGRVCLILFNWDQVPVDTVKWFEYNLWNGGLSELTNSGFLLICVSESCGDSGQDELFSWAPTCSLYLPPVYQGSDKLHALEDMAGILQRLMEIDSEEAHARADSLLTANRSPSEAYNAIIAHQMRAITAR